LGEGVFFLVGGGGGGGGGGGAWGGGGGGVKNPIFFVDVENEWPLCPHCGDPLPLALGHP